MLMRQQGGGEGRNLHLQVDGGADSFVFVSCPHQYFLEREHRGHAEVRVQCCGGPPPRQPFDWSEGHLFIAVEAMADSTQHCSRRSDHKLPCVLY